MKKKKVVLAIVIILLTICFSTSAVLSKTDQEYTNACQAIKGNKFRSLENLKSEFGSNDIVNGPWYVTFFPNAVFEHERSGIIEDGLYECNEGWITSAYIYKLGHNGYYDIRTGILEWDNQQYKLEIKGIGRDGPRDEIMRRNGLIIGKATGRNVLRGKAIVFNAAVDQQEEHIEINNGMAHRAFLMRKHGLAD